jgi:putative ABC transport system permease protein
MSTTGFFYRLKALFSKGRVEDDLSEELQFHLRNEIQKNTAAGMTPEEARYTAFRTFGGVDQVKEQCRDVRATRFIEELCQDIRHGLRSLFKSPGFAAAVVLMLGLGIGANTAIFSVVNAVLLRPLAYLEPDRIVSVETFRKDMGQSSRNVSAPDFKDWQAQNTVFASMAYHLDGGQLATVVNGAAEYANVQLVSPDFFSVFGLSPAAGHLLTPDENRSPVAVVSYNWAASHFGNIAAAVGRPLKVYGHAIEIVGVVALGSRYPEGTDVWLPVGLTGDEPSRTAHNYQAVGKLKTGVSLAFAQEQMRLIGDRLEAQYPENRFKTVSLTPLQDRLTANVRMTLWVLLGAVAVVLLIACANVANLLLARAAARAREIAVRAALGASRGRVLRQLLTESLLLAFLGTAAGMLSAHLFLKTFLALVPAYLPRIDEVRIDLPVLLFALGAAIVCSLLFGLAPALHASRLELTEALKQSGSNGSMGTNAGRLRRALVVTEVALSVILLAGAGLLLRSFQRLNKVDLGFATESVLVADTSYPANTDDDIRRSSQFYRDLLERVRVLPGVMHAAGMRFTPLGGFTPDSGYFIEGRPEGRPGEYPSALMQVVTPGYFETLRIPVKLGRGLSEADRSGSPLVAIINERLAQVSFPGENPLGYRLRTGFRSTTMQWMEIVGVVGNTRRLDPGKPAAPELFVPALQHPGAGRDLSLVIRTRLEPNTSTSVVRELVHQLNPDVPVRFETMEQVFSQSLAYPRLRTLLIGTFAALAAMLAMLGIYSVLSYLVGQRTREFGIRFALGAQTGDVVRLVMSEGLHLVVVGLVIGLSGAFALAQILSTLLYGVSTSDLPTYTGVIALIVVAALLASSIPALRAARVNPILSLRDE